MKNSATTKPSPAEKREARLEIALAVANQDRAALRKRVRELTRLLTDTAQSAYSHGIKDAYGIFLRDQELAKKLLHQYMAGWVSEYGQYLKALGEEP